MFGSASKVGPFKLIRILQYRFIAHVCTDQQTKMSTLNDITKMSKATTRHPLGWSTPGVMIPDDPVMTHLGDDTR